MRKLKIFIRSSIMRWLYSDWEIVCLLNALYRRTEDDSTKETESENLVKQECELIARELSK